MAEVNILIVVDVLGANTPNQGGLANNVWMLDTGKYNGTREAGNELVTTLNSGDEIAWTVQAIDPGTNVAFASPSVQFPQAPFTGQAVTAPAVINPQQNPVIPNEYVARFSPPASTKAGTQYQYSVVLTMDGQPQSFDPFLKLFTAS